MPPGTRGDARDPSRGLFTVRGQAIRIPEGGLTISVDETSRLSARLTGLEVSLDMCALWLRTSLDQLDRAAAANSAAVHASTVGNDQLLAASLEAECVAGMLTICATAFALDAFYAALKDQSPRVARIPIARGRHRSAQYTIVAEALRREFRVGGAGLMNLRRALRDIFRFRGYAVHPRAEFTLPVLKPEINRITEWRFVSFGAPSARNALRAGLAILVQLAARPRQPSERLSVYLNGLRPELETLAARWRSTYGLLTDEA